MAYVTRWASRRTQREVGFLFLNGGSNGNGYLCGSFACFPLHAMLDDLIEGHPSKVACHIVMASIFCGPLAFCHGHIISCAMTIFQSFLYARLQGERRTSVTVRENVCPLSLCTIDVVSLEFRYKQ
jgi:hypothetical protein